MSKPVIVCVDDEKVVLTSLRQELEYGLGDRFTFEIAESGEEGLEVIDEFMDLGLQVPVVISDQLMPGMKGDEFLSEVNKMDREIKKILLTGQASADAVGNAVNRANLYRYIAKPWDEKDLKLTVEEAAKSFFMNQKLEVKIKILEDLNKYAELVSKELNPETMLDAFLKNTLRDTGAQNGALLFFPGDEVVWTAEGTRNEADIETQFFYDPTTSAFRPESLFSFVKDRREQVVLNNAFKRSDFREDEYIADNKIRSVFCAPVMVDNQLLSILYLEHRRTMRYFDKEKLEFLTLLLAQAATGFDNSLLYHNLERKIEERTRTIQLMNQELKNSITYASRIQHTILPPKEMIRKSLPESAVFYRAKDIVSGDFYWFEEIDGKKVMAAVDCTGHGVPGAFMTVIGYTQLNHIVMEAKVFAPDEILRQLDLRVRKALNQDAADADSNDGMDMSIVVIDEENGKLEFAGAMNPLIHVREGELELIKGDKFPIGGSQYAEKQFTTHSIDLEKGDRVYLASDGFIDQFGGDGARSKRYGTRRFKELLLTHHRTPMSELEYVWETEYDRYRGEEEQLDDVMVIGIEF